MANSGPNTNGSQFFITYRSCRHLDGKHTVFGKLVGGLEVLTEMEQVEVDNRDRPIENIFIQRAQVFVDPFQEADEQLANARAEELERVQREAQEKQSKMNKAQPLKVFRSGVGKYLDKDITKRIAEPEASTSSETNLEKRRKTEAKIKQMGNFSSW